MDNNFDQQDFHLAVIGWCFVTILLAIAYRRPIMTGRSWTLSRSIGVVVALFSVSLAICTAIAILAILPYFLVVSLRRAARVPFDVATTRFLGAVWTGMTTSILAFAVFFTGAALEINSLFSAGMAGLDPGYGLYRASGSPMALLLFGPAVWWAIGMVVFFVGDERPIPE